MIKLSFEIFSLRKSLGIISNYWWCFGPYLLFLDPSVPVDVAELIWCEVIEIKLMIPLCSPLRKIEMSLAI